MLLIGTKNCGRCNMTKKILDNKGINYEYKLLDDLTQEEKDLYLSMARKVGLMSFPLIIKNNNAITLQEV